MAKEKAQSETLEVALWKSADKLCKNIDGADLSNDDLLNKHIFQYLKNIYPLLRAIALSGTTMPIINKTYFEKVEILLLSNKILEEFNKITSPLNQKIIQKYNKSKHLKTYEIHSCQGF